jgi:hypothetical protein
MEFERTITKISDGNDGVGTKSDIIKRKEIVELTEDQAEKMINHYLINDGFSKEGKWEKLKNIGTVVRIEKEVSKCR